MPAPRLQCRVRGAEPLLRTAALLSRDCIATVRKSILPALVVRAAAPVGGEKAEGEQATASSLLVGLAQVWAVELLAGRLKVTYDRGGDMFELELEPVAGEDQLQALRALFERLRDVARKTFSTVRFADQSVAAGQAADGHDAAVASPTAAPSPAAAPSPTGNTLATPPSKRRKLASSITRRVFASPPRQAIATPHAGAGSGSGGDGDGGGLGARRALTASRPLPPSLPLATGSGGGGLYNPRNACYMNACLQALARAQPVLQNLRRAQDRGGGGGDGGAIAEHEHEHEHERRDAARRCVDAFLEAAEYLAESDKRRGKGAVSRVPVHDPTPVRRALAACAAHGMPGAEVFASGQQQDAHEFVKFLMDAFEAACGAQAVADCMELRLRQTVECKACPYQSEQVLVHHDLSLDLAGDGGDGGNGGNGVAPRGVGELLQSFLAPEELADLKCERCGKSGGRKRLTPATCGPLVLVQLKRFTSAARKLCARVALDREVHLGDARLRLAAVVSHRGTSTHMGHYVAAVRAGDGWLLCNDEHVQQVPEAALLDTEKAQREAYLLLFERCS